MVQAGEKGAAAASLFGSDFNFDFNASFTGEELRGGVEYNFRRDDSGMNIGKAGVPDFRPAEFAAMTGTDVGTYLREREGMSAFAVEDGAVYHTYATHARGVDSFCGVYHWLDRAPKGGNETRDWFRCHDEYDNH